MLELMETLELMEKGGEIVVTKGRRRTAEDLAVKYCCQVDGCDRFYSAESALQRHIKMKHRSIKVDPP
jgi:hypothetical protein